MTISKARTDEENASISCQPKMKRKMMFLLRFLPLKSATSVTANVVPNMSLIARKKADDTKSRCMLWKQTNTAKGVPARN